MWNPDTKENRQLRNEWHIEQATTDRRYGTYGGMRMQTPVARWKKIVALKGWDKIADDLGKMRDQKLELGEITSSEGMQYEAVIQLLHDDNTRAMDKQRAVASLGVKEGAFEGEGLREVPTETLVKTLFEEGRRYVGGEREAETGGHDGQPEPDPSGGDGEEDGERPTGARKGFRDDLPFS